MASGEQRPAGCDLSNWREAPFSRWSFRHVRELVPTARIAAAAEPTLFAKGLPRPAIGDLAVGLPDGGTGPLATFLAASHSSAFTIVHDGTLVYSWTAPGVGAGDSHLLFSVSKSLTALLAGILIGDGVLDAETPVAALVPEIEGSAFEDASLRHLLDMTVSLDFEEAYLDQDSPFARYRRAMLWNPQRSDDEGDLLSFLATLPKASGEHGTRFFYASPNSDLLGIVVERAAGMPYARLLSERLWQKMGAASDANVTLDRSGTARAAGGISATSADLARLGELVRLGGEADGRQVVPRSFVDDLWTGGDRAAWLSALDPSTLMPAGRYRSQWYAVGDADDCLCAIGIHGQWIYVNRKRRTVGVRLASQPLPVDQAIDAATLVAFGSIAELLHPNLTSGDMP